jgi:hypothetical protein
VKILVSFPKTYECEVGFSSLLQIKTKLRSRLSVEGNLQCALSSASQQMRLGSSSTSATFPLCDFFTSADLCKKIIANLTK